MLTVNMKTHIKALALTFIILFLGIHISNTLENSDVPQTSKNFMGFDQSQVAFFHVNNFTTSHIFKKDPSGAWWIREGKNDLVNKLEKTAPQKELAEHTETAFEAAKSSEVSKALTYLFELKNLKPISTGLTEPGLYEINRYSLHVVFYNKDKKELDRIYIGKHGPDPLTSFLNRLDSEQVYLVNQDFRLLFFRNYKEWLL